jgi:predicted Fe-Mo cluster-binding NifX family protein
MKYAVPVLDQTLEAEVCPTFARAPYFFIYDTRSKTFSFEDNDKAVSSTGGAGVKAAQLIVDLNIDALVTPRCGENAAEVFTDAKILLFKALNQTLKETLETIKKDQLIELTTFHGGFHGVNHDS